MYLRSNILILNDSLNERSTKTFCFFSQFCRSAPQSWLSFPVMWEVSSPVETTGRENGARFPSEVAGITSHQGEPTRWSFTHNPKTKETPAFTWMGILGVKGGRVGIY